MNYNLNPGFGTIITIFKGGGLSLDDDDKHKVLGQLDEQAEGEPSEDVMDIDSELEKAGLRPDPEGNIKELHSSNDLLVDEENE